MSQTGFLDLVRFRMMIGSCIFFAIKYLGNSEEPHVMLLMTKLSALICVLTCLIAVTRKDFEVSALSGTKNAVYSKMDRLKSPCAKLFKLILGAFLTSFLIEILSI